MAQRPQCTKLRNGTIQNKSVVVEDEAPKNIARAVQERQRIRRLDRLTPLATSLEGHPTDDAT